MKEEQLQLSALALFTGGTLIEVSAASFWGINALILILFGFALGLSVAALRKAPQSRAAGLTLVLATLGLVLHLGLWALAS